MSMFHLDPGMTNHPTCMGNPQDTDLPMIFVSRPAIKIPRSAQGNYTDSELSSAASMLAKMRRREDVVARPESPCDADRVIDAVVENLLGFIE